MRVHLFAPSDPANFQAAATSGAEALWLEGPGSADILRATRQQTPNVKFYVCLGGLDDLCGHDLDMAMDAATDGIVVPTRHGADVQQLGVKLAVREAELGFADGATRIIALIDTPGPIFHLGGFAGASPRLAALAFDMQAFATSVGIADLSAPPVSRARELTLLAAKAAGVAAILVAATDSADEYKAAKRDGFDAIVVSAIPQTS